MRRLLSSLALVAAAVAPARGQVPDVPTPDTLGANFRHDSIGTSTPTDFDFLDGKWNIRFQSRKSATEFNPARAGMGGSETVLGTVLGDRRKDIVLATKYAKPMSNDGTKQGASRRYIMEAVEASLKRLKTDYIDLYQQHDYDPLTPMEETLRALDDLVRQGKVRYLGNSNFPACRIAEAETMARQMNVNRFIPCQDEYSLVVRGIEKDLLPAATEYKLGLLPFFPLASGLLTGKYKRGADAPADTRFAKAPALKDRYVTARNEDIVEKLQAFASERGHTLLELAFSWLAQRPQVASVIAGATRVEQVEQNVKAIGWTLSAEDMAAVDQMTK